MAAPGTKPKPPGQALHRNPTLEWTDVVDVPFDGESPDLPEGDWSSFTVRWWDVVRRLPHAINWHAGDWLSAIECAAVVEKTWENPTAELRIREKALGLTTDALRDLRIRYVKADDASGDNVTKISDYRSL
jgi:hypothetical protein